MKNSSNIESNPINKTITTMEGKFKQGDVVYERIRPYQKLIVNRYSSSLYYCKDESRPERKELVYFEKELMADSSLTIRNTR